MKLNLDYYTKDISLYKDIYLKNYSDEIKNIEDKTKKIRYDDYLSCDNSNFTFNSLSSIKRNILDWYNFKENASILQIGIDFGILTNMFCEKGLDVTSIAFSKEQAEKVAHKLIYYDNLEIIVGKLTDIKFSKKYDYITLIGCAEVCKILFDGNLQDLLIYLKKLLKPSGTLILAINNELAIKYLIGAASEYENEKLYSRNDLEEIVKSLNFKNYTFYYPLPDYKITNVIFSDKFLPNHTNSKLMYNLNYLEYSYVTNNELDRIKNITKNNMFDKFANSFLVIMDLDDVQEENDIKFISYNNMRKDEYRLITKMHDTFVRKINQNEKSKIHIKVIKENINLLSSFGFKLLDTLNENGEIDSKFSSYPTFNKVLTEMYISKDKSEVLNKIMFWKKEVIDKIPNCSFEEIKDNNIFTISKIKVDDEILKSMNMTKYGFFDLVFENAFVDENSNLIFYDQEWILENIPKEFILFRAINNIYLYDFEIEKVIPKHEVLEFLEIDKYVDIFNELEVYIQFMILDKKRVSSYGKSYEFRVIDEEKIRRSAEIEKLTNSINNLSKENERILLELSNKNEELKFLYKNPICKLMKKLKK